MDHRAARMPRADSKAQTSEPEIERQAVQPFGLSGVGVVTGHPVGLVLVAGVILITVEAIPASRWFVAAAVGAGIAFGGSLWLYHRNKGL